MIDTSLHSCWTVPVVDIANSNRDTANSKRNIYEYHKFLEQPLGFPADTEINIDKSESQQLTGACVFSKLSVVTICSGWCPWTTVKSMTDSLVLGVTAWAGKVQQKECKLYMRNKLNEGARQNKDRWTCSNMMSCTFSGSENQGDWVTKSHQCQTCPCWENWLRTSHPRKQKEKETTSRTPNKSIWFKHCLVSPCQNTKEWCMFIAYHHPSSTINHYQLCVIIITHWQKISKSRSNSPQ